MTRQPPHDVWSRPHPSAYPPPARPPQELGGPVPFLQGAGGPAGPPVPGGPPQVAGPAKRRRALVLALMTVVLVLIGAGTAVGVMRLVRGGGGSLAVAWALPWSGPGSGTLQNPTDATREVWPSAGTVVRVQSDGIVAFRVSDGTVAWGTPVPDGRSVCTASPTAPEGVGVFVHGGDRVCDRLAGIDLRSGELLFDVEIEAEDRERPARTAPAVIAVDGAAVILGEGTAAAYGIPDGALRWAADPPRLTCVFGQVIAGPDRVFLSQACVEDGLSGADSVVALDLATGAKLWTTPMNGTVLGFLSASPPVANVYREQNGGAEESVFVVLGAEGTVTASLPLDENGLRVADGRTIGVAEQEDVFLANVHDGVLYLPSDQTGRNSVVALDLSTGERRWESTGIDRTPNIIRVDDQGVLVLETSVDTARLLRVDLATGAATELAAGSFDMFELPLGLVTVVEIDGTVVMAPYLQGAGDEERALTALR